MSKRAFITGGSGLFGLNFILQNIYNYDFCALQNNTTISLPNTQTVHMNLEDLVSIETCLNAHLPDFVIHAAGMTNVDDCEENPAKANYINGTLAGNLAKITHEMGIKFIHISTDHLFDGTTSFVSEEKEKNPINAYGFSKAFGEDLVIKNNPDSLIIRCNFYGWGPSYKMSFSDFIINSLSNSSKIQLADDYYYTPSSTSGLVNSINSLIARNAKGIFNVVGSERVSKYDFGLKVANIFELSDSFIEQVSSKSLNLKTKRPSDMSLSDKKLHNFIGKNIGIISVGINELKEQLNSQLYNKIKTL